MLNKEELNYLAMLVTIDQRTVVKNSLQMWRSKSMKVNHDVCKYCIYSQYGNINYICTKKDNICIKVLEDLKFDCSYHKEL